MEDIAGAMAKSTDTVITVDILKKLVNEKSAKKRKKILESSEGLIGSEIELALINEAAKGNVNAIKFYLKSRMPDKYSDKPQPETEIEDVSEIKEMIDNAEDQGG